jgi:hypothetical protein
VTQLITKECFGAETSPTVDSTLTECAHHVNSSALSISSKFVGFLVFSVPRNLFLGAENSALSAEQEVSAHK